MVFWFWGTGDWPGWRRHLGLLGDPGGEGEAGWRGLDWPELAWPGGRLVQPVPSPPEPKNLRKNIKKQKKQCFGTMGGGLVGPKDCFFWFFLGFFGLQGPKPKKK